jgi:hypothetical protein
MRLQGTFQIQTMASTVPLSYTQVPLPHTYVLLICEFTTPNMTVAPATMMETHQDIMSICGKPTYIFNMLDNSTKRLPET